MPVLLPFLARFGSPSSLYVPGEEAPVPLPANSAYCDLAGLFGYRQRFRFPGPSQESARLGVMGLIDTKTARILPHEETIAQHLEAVRIGLENRIYDPGPLWLWCNDPDDALAMGIEPKRTPEIVVQDRSGCVHEYWSIRTSRSIRDAQAALTDKALFLADGHHRYAAGWRFGVIQIRNRALYSLSSHRLLVDPFDLNNMPELKPVGDIEDYLAATPGGKRRFVVCAPESPPQGFEAEDGVNSGHWLRAGTPMRGLQNAVEAVRCRNASKSPSRLRAIDYSDRTGRIQWTSASTQEYRLFSQTRRWNRDLCRGIRGCSCAGSGFAPDALLSRPGKAYQQHTDATTIRLR